MQEVKNLLARVFNFAAFQSKKAKRKFCVKPVRVLKVFVVRQKHYFLDYIQLNRYCQYL